jgi:hypothetical protein
MSSPIEHHCTQSNVPLVHNQMWPHIEHHCTQSNVPLSQPNVDGYRVSLYIAECTRVHSQISAPIENDCAQPNVPDSFENNGSFGQKMSCAADHIPQTGFFGKKFLSAQGVQLFVAVPTVHRGTLGGAYRRTYLHLSHPCDGGHRDGPNQIARPDPSS